jgi:flavodoxin
MSRNKSLIAYYSRPGANILDGHIVDMPEGNTEVVANIIRSMTGADVFRIDTVEPYPADYDETTDVAKAELRKNARPAFAGHVQNLGDYGTVYLGFPNWWGTIPMVVCTFLEAYDFTGVIVAPFCTHEGSGMGRSEAHIKSLCPNATVSHGLAIRGGDVHDSHDTVAVWLESLGTAT